MYIMLFVDEKYNSVSALFKSLKLRHLTRSAVVNDEVDFVEMNDAVVTLNKELSRLLWCNIPLQLLTEQNQTVYSTSFWNINVHLRSDKYWI